LEDPRKEVSDKEHQDSIASKNEALPLSVEDHINNYTKFPADLFNVNVAIEEENKASILLNSLPDEEYETFVLILINGKQTLNYSDVSAVLVNYEVRRKDKQSSFMSTSTEALMVRGRSFSKKGKGDRCRSKSRPGFSDMRKNQCVFCKESGH